MSSCSIQEGLLACRAWHKDIQLIFELLVGQCITCQTTALPNSRPASVQGMLVGLHRLFPYLPSSLSTW